MIGVSFLLVVHPKNFMKKYIVFLVCIIFATALKAQPSDYWQQHVSYTISGTLIDSIHSFDGKLSVVYTNNSPDVLNEVYFHLYANAFQPGSMMHERAKALGDFALANKMDNYRKSDWGNYIFSEVTVDGTSARFEVTGTVMKVTLSKPLAPKQRVTIAMPFFEQIPLQTRRSGWMNNDSIKYSMCQWYPKICEYDREGWHHEEYISREFYGVWGEFDVTMTVPSQFCVASTGQCQNPKEVGWGYDSIANGIKKGKAYPKDFSRSGNTTWHFKAENVHDFAWLAHEYIHEWDTWSDTITVHCFYKANEDISWKDAMKHTLYMLDHHSKKVGWYQYRNFSNTHGGDGGMEYPQLIMDGSASAGLIAHEGGHQWFYGMLGNDETRYAFLDEGFTEFIEMTMMEAYYGRHQRINGTDDRPWLSKMFIPEDDTRRRYYSSYLNLATSGYEEPLMIPHDWARENVNAGQVYFKTLNGLAQLEYVLGDSMFWAGMKEYFRRWHFKHPSLNDFKRTMEQVSGADLNYYFDQWFYTTRTIDYDAGCVSSDKRTDGSFDTKVTINNESVTVMPLDLTLHYDDGSIGLATIPIGLNQKTGYQKPEAGRLFFPSWDWVNRKYEGSIVTPKEVSWFEIDSSYRLMDLNHANNYSGMFPPVEWTLWKQTQTAPPLSGLYGVFRPIIWYEETSKLNLGVGLLFGNTRIDNGDFKIIFKTAPKAIAPTPNFYDGTNREDDAKIAEVAKYVDYQLKGIFHTKLLGNLTDLSYNIRKMYGVNGVDLSLDHTIRPTYLSLGATHKVKFYYSYTDRGFVPDYHYPVFGSQWTDGAVSTMGGLYSFTSHDGDTKFSAGVEQGGVIRKFYSNFFLFSSGQYDFFGGWNVKLSQEVKLANEFGLKIRANATGQWGYVPTQKLYTLNSANGVENDQNSFWQSITSISRHFSTQAHFINEGGAGVRGASSISSYGGFGLGADLNLPNPLRSLGWLASSFKPILFFDAGWVGDEVNFSLIRKQLMTDAGIGLKLNILSWLPGQLQGVAEEYSDIPTIGFYFPLYVNHPNDGKKNIDFRYVISLGTTF